MKTIMTVDDSASMRQMVSFVLKSAGYDVVEAVDGVDALEKLKGQDLSLVLSDINMPNMDGLEFSRQLRAMPQYKFVPIILLTTESHPEKKQEGKAAGVTGWIVKPFNPEQLLTVAKKVIR
jgi:two-component system, chemotaxis family, chemotaxis protein CheY